ncbi:MAG: hypothetical protein JSW58_08325 [Candidatus Latescibacterota bacterium]|nr:MAG: hypothetical protein JSW58_08325 [Candidatus Latescibacterota bacterium]
MSREKTDILKLHVDQIEMKRFEVFDLNLVTSFSLSSGTWELRARPGGSVVLSGSVTVNNSDTDRAGNTIKTVSMTIDTQDTDVGTGHYWLLIYTVLSTGQTDVFRYPVEMIDLVSEV